MKTILYDVDKYNFVEEVRRLYDVEDLCEIHNQWNHAKPYDILDDPSKDQKTVYHEKFYNEVKSKTNFYSIYHSFLRDIIVPLFNEDVLYQKVPTFRVHQPNNFAVGSWHKDCEYNHSKDEINFYLPLTKARGTNTIWVETERGNSDFKPMDSDVGELVMWDGSNLMHGNKLNTTEMSRVSVDFRILPLSSYKKENDNISITNKTPMNIGGYWEYYKD